jgi:cAMP phosphodiesterase
VPMEIRVLGCNGGILPGFRSSSFLINERVLIDSGHVAGALTLEEQNKVRDIFITHFHLDHTKDIAFLTDNAFGNHDLPIKIYGTAETISGFENHFFNNVTWPDFTKINSENRPIVRLLAIRAGQKTSVKGMDVIPFGINHSVDGVGYVVRDGSSAVVFSGDTGPTEMMWEVINEEPNVKALFIETSFPNEFQAIADSSGHFTPQTLDTDLRKLKKTGIPVYLYHLKPKYFDVLTEEIRALGRDNLIILQNDLSLTF